VALNVRKIREVKLVYMMQGVIVVFFFNVLSLHLSATVEEYHKKPHSIRIALIWAEIRT